MTATEYLRQLHETRSQRLKELVHTFDSTQEAAREIGCYSASYLSRLIAGKDPFNENVARKIEDSFGLAFGALDIVK